MIHFFFQSFYMWFILSMLNLFILFLTYYNLIASILLLSLQAKFSLFQCFCEIFIVEIVYICEIVFTVGCFREDESSPSDTYILFDVEKQCYFFTDIFEVQLLAVLLSHFCIIFKS